MRSARVLILLGIALCACGGEVPEAGGSAEPVREAVAPGSPEPSQAGPPHARWDMVEMLRESQDLPYDASDGGGRAWLEAAEPALPTVSRPARFELVYETGPLGIAKGGVIYLQVSPFWGWSTPQVANPDAPGYTVLSTEAEGVVLDAQTLDQQLLGIRVNGRGLEPGEQVRIVYGEGVGALYRATLCGRG